MHQQGRLRGNEVSVRKWMTCRGHVRAAPWPSRSEKDPARIGYTAIKKRLNYQPFWRAKRDFPWKQIFMKNVACLKCQKSRLLFWHAEKNLKGRYSPWGFLNWFDNNDTVSNSFIWFHSKNETIKREVKLSFSTETMLISLSNWNLSIYPINGFKEPLS